jgi:transcription elongation factor Elf1
VPKTFRCPICEETALILILKDAPFSRCGECGDTFIILQSDGSNSYSIYEMTLLDEREPITPFNNGE